MQITEVAWSRPIDERAGTPLIVALHGRGADESTMVGLSAYLPSQVTVAALRGPVPLPDGWTWFENRGIGRPVAESITATADAVLAWLDTVRDAHPMVMLLGFSGGTAMAGGLLFTAPERFDGAVLLSGTLPWDAGLDASPGRFAGLPLFWGFDAADPVIPRELVNRSEAWLRDESGAALVERFYPGMGHGMSAEELADVSAFVTSVIAQVTPESDASA